MNVGTSRVVEIMSPPVEAQEGFWRAMSIVLRSPAESVQRRLAAAPPEEPATFRA